MVLSPYKIKLCKYRFSFMFQRQNRLIYLFIFTLQHISVFFFFPFLPSSFQRSDNGEINSRTQAVRARLPQVTKWTVTRSILLKINSLPVTFQPHSVGRWLITLDLVSSLGGNVVLERSIFCSPSTGQE